MRGSRARIVLALLACTALVIGGAGTVLAQEATGTPAGEKLIFDVGITEDIVSPNPFRACCTADYEFLNMNYDMLFAFSPEDLSPIPSLATTSEHTDDYMTWTFTIRDDVTWHDGQPLTAEDIAFTYQFIVDNSMGFFKDYFPYDPTFEAPNATTLIWNSSEPTFAPTIPPWVYILPKHVWEGFDKTEAKEFENVPAVGSGPFQLVEWEKDQFFRMVANEDYWGGAPKAIDEVVFHIYKSQEAMVQALKEGEIQFAENLTPTLFGALEGEPDIQTHMAPAGCFSNLAFNFGGQEEIDPKTNDTHHPAINDLTVRQAAAHAIDKEAVVERVLLGGGTPGDSIIRPQQAFWYYDIPAEEEFAFDLDLANQMLEDAGYKDTDEDGVREMPGGGDPLVWQILTLPDETGSVEIGKLIRGWYEEIGIEVELVPVSTNKAYSLWFDGDFDAYVWGWCGDPDPDFMLSLHTTEQCLGWSDGCYSNSEFDAMYEEQRTLFDREERRAFIQDMQLFLYKETVQIVVAYENDLQAFRTDTWSGYVPTPGADGFYLFGWGPQSYMNLQPVKGAETGPKTTGLSVGIWIAIVAGAIVVILLVAVLRRRGGGEEEQV